MIRSALSWKEVGRRVLFGGEVQVVSQRTFSKKLIPRLPVPAESEKWKRRMRRKEERIEDEEYAKEIRKEAAEAFETYGEVPDPDFKQFKQAALQEMQERERLEEKIRRQKAFRLNYGYLVKKELNLLTYAEKEKIKFLHEQSPEEWTPEVISQSFPISAEGAFKVIKSTFKARSLKEIQDHDQRVSEVIEKVKSGEIPSTRELEERMKMRQQTPFVPGAVGPKSTKLLMKAQAPVVLGEFARLVAPPELLQSSSNQETARVPAIPTIVNDTTAPDEGDSFMLTSKSEAARQLRRLNINPKETMTLKEFKSNLKDVNQPNSTELMTASDVRGIEPHQSVEIKYIKQYASQDENPNTYSAPAEDSDMKYEDADYLNYHSISKYKSTVNQELKKQEVSMFKKNSSDNESDIEMPPRREIQDSWNPPNIEVPPEMRRPGAVYKRGRSYYDENGVFLYRVV